MRLFRRRHHQRVQGRQHDVDEAKNRRASTQRNPKPGPRRVGPAGHKAGLHGGDHQVQQVGLEGGPRQVRKVDGRIWIILIVSSFVAAPFQVKLISLLY